MTYNSPEDFIVAIQTTWDSGDYNGAQQLSMQAVEQYPEHKDLQEIAYILAPSKITVVKRPRDRDTLVNQDWIKQNRMQYRGLWVALKDGQLLATGKNVDELVEQVGDIKEKRIFVTAIY